MRTVGSSISVFTLAAFGVLGTACHHHHGRAHEGHGDGVHEGKQSPELGSGISTGIAVRAITNARCEREERCENVGAGKRWDSADQCEAKTKSEWQGDLNKYECPKGVVQAELEECLKGIREESCGNPFDALARIVQCNASDICDGD